MKRSTQPVGRRSIPSSLEVVQLQMVFSRPTSASDSNIPIGAEVPRTLMSCVYPSFAKSKQPSAPVRAEPEAAGAIKGALPSVNSCPSLGAEALHAPETMAPASAPSRKRVCLVGPKGEGQPVAPSRYRSSGRLPHNGLNSHAARAEAPSNKTKAPL